MFTKSSVIAGISVIHKSERSELDHGIGLFSDYLQKKWAFTQESACGLVKDEFYDPKSTVLKAENLGKFIGVVCVAPFDIINFPDLREKEKVLRFFEEKKIESSKIIHIGGLGLDYNNSIIDLTWWSRFLIFAALKVCVANGWKYSIGQSKAGDTIISKIAAMFRCRELPIKTYLDGVPECWFLKKLA